jgi:hypothetical protein
MDEKKLRLWKLLLDNGRVTIENIPEPYKSALYDYIVA